MRGKFQRLMCSEVIEMKYEKPVIEIVRLEKSDIIVTSTLNNGGTGGSTGGGNGDFGDDNGSFGS